ncbi:MAG: hypothetical protein LBV60_19640 [Streptomyces sp.]|jgi:uncharacterized coiled-coil protein SlyX|nr:hypothetical protein [Streptomyces sp.]
MARRQHPTVRAPKANQQERVQRRIAIDHLLVRALHGSLSPLEAERLAEYVRAEQQVADKTRESLARTTRALERRTRAFDATIQEFEARIAELEAALGIGDEVPQEAADGPVARLEPAPVAPDVQAAPDAAHGRTAA